MDKQYVVKKHTADDPEHDTTEILTTQEMWQVHPWLTHILPAEFEDCPFSARVLKYHTEWTIERYEAAPKDTRSADRIALDRYNAKWKGPINPHTNQLYNLAVAGETATYGCWLQDHVLALMGHTHRTETLRYVSPQAQAFVDWMLEE